MEAVARILYQRHGHAMGYLVVNWAGETSEYRAAWMGGAGPIVDAVLAVSGPLLRAEIADEIADELRDMANNDGSGFVAAALHRMLGAADRARAHAMRSIARMIETREAAGMTEPELAAKLRRMADVTAPEETDHG